MIRFLAVLLALAAPTAAFADTHRDLAPEIARLRARLAAGAAQEHQCLAGATQKVWGGATTKDLQQLKDRARQMQERAQRGGGAGGDTEAWRALQQRVEQLEAQARADARSGADLLSTQAIGMDCLDRFAGEREALRASLELVLADPDAYKASLREARDGGASLRWDVTTLHARALAWAARFRAQASFEQLAGEAASLGQQAAALRRRHAAALESELNRALAEPVLRAAELLVGTLSAWQEERAAGSTAARADASQLKQMRWGNAQRLLSEAARAAN